MSLFKAAVLLSVLSIAAFGQGLTGSISGSVLDPSGSAIVGATITIHNVATGLTRETKSDSDGSYLFTQLLPGTFRLTASAAGFKRHEQTDVVLSATERLVIPAVRLELGDVTQTVTVEAEARGCKPSRPNAAD